MMEMDIVVDMQMVGADEEGAGDEDAFEDEDDDRVIISLSHGT